MRAVVGTDRWRYTLLQRNIQFPTISKVVLHPDWNSRTAKHDIAMVKVSKPIDFNPRVQPICLPSSDQLPAAGSQATIAGYGFTSENIIARLPTNLKYARIPIIGNSTCFNTYKKSKIDITEQMICAGSALDGQCIGALKGDSGSALITYDADGRAVHTGIVSFALTPCHITAAPDVYTRTAAYLPWIRMVLDMK